MQFRLYLTCLLALYAVSANAVVYGPFPNDKGGVIGAQTESGEFVYDCLVPVTRTALQPGQVVKAVFQSQKFSEAGTLELQSDNLAVFRPTTVMAADGRKLKIEPAVLSYPVRNEEGAFFVLPDYKCAASLN